MSSTKNIGNRVESCRTVTPFRNSRDLAKLLEGDVNVYVERDIGNYECRVLHNDEIFSKLVVEWFPVIKVIVGND